MDGYIPIMSIVWPVIHMCASFKFNAKFVIILHIGVIIINGILQILLLFLHNSIHQASLTLTQAIQILLQLTMVQALIILIHRIPFL